MSRIAILKKTTEKAFSETEVYISELNFEVTRIFVPFKRKIKRRNKDKLIQLVSRFDYVFTSDSELEMYEKGVSIKSWLRFFLIEGISYITKSVNCDKITVKTESVDELFEKIISKLSERYRIIELYTNQPDIINERLNSFYQTFGTPIQIKDGTDCSSFVLKIDSDVSILDAYSETLYTDIKVEFTYPLSKYSELPMEKILKCGLEEGVFSDVIKKGMVKIVGEISK